MSIKTQSSLSSITLQRFDIEKQTKTYVNVNFFDHKVKKDLMLMGM